MSKNINDLREAMFDTLAKLKAGELSVEQARAASQIGGVIIESAKVEVEYIKANNGGEMPILEAIGSDNLPPGVLGITRHRLAG